MVTREAAINTAKSFVRECKSNGLLSKVNIKYPIIETHPYPTNYYKDGDDFITEISIGEYRDKIKCNY